MSSLYYRTIELMIYRRNQAYTRLAGGYVRLRSMDNRSMFGHGYGDHIRLRDEFGTVWRGVADLEDGNLVRYRFRDDKGHSISGISDSYGVLLRDDKGRSWRGSIE